MAVVIKAENISKQYRLGEVGTGALAHDVNRWWHRIRGNEDPYLKIGESNDRTVKGSSEYVWALKDINFDVQQGEVLGIIGRNGAGKSTLLKILSKTTTPTTGNIKIRGRIASLLEVGTGFHPELTGRDNIYLNGAILGMTKKEISSKFDEIVDFAGVERYIDTPVKRYSSGMYVRLAFGVAAHLEPEILVVDEVLAVGDAEFQKKALGKMKDVSGKDGRTVLFVSHNMNAIKNLCDTVLYMENGMIAERGETETVINKYLSRNIDGNMIKVFDEQDAPGNEYVRIKKIGVRAADNNDSFSINTPLTVEFDFFNNEAEKQINLSMHLSTLSGESVFACVTEAERLGKGFFKSTCEIPSHFLNDNLYQITMMIVGDGMPIYNYEEGISFEIHEDREKGNWHGKWPGVVRPKLNFKIVGY